jgi:hypothetical protein
MYYKKYLKYKNKYLQLKTLQSQNAGTQFFVAMSRKRTQSIDSVEEQINDTDDLIERIRTKFDLPEPAEFILTTIPPVKASSHSHKLPIIREGQTINIQPLVQRITDSVGPTILTKLFSHLYDLYNDNATIQIIVVPYSSNTEYREESIEKNIKQQFQPMNINPRANTIIYVLFDEAFFKGINKEFYDFVNFTENRVDFELSDGERLKIKKYTSPRRYEYNITDEVSEKYCEFFDANVRELLTGKQIIFYVVNAKIANDKLFKDECSRISNCGLFSFEGASYD